MITFRTLLVSDRCMEIFRAGDMDMDGCPLSLGPNTNCHDKRLFPLIENPHVARFHKIPPSAVATYTLKVRGATRTPRARRMSRWKGRMGEVRPPVALLRSVSPWERVVGNIVQPRRRPAGEFQGVEAPPDVGKDLADDRGLGDEAHDAHSLAARAQKRVDLVDTPDEAGP